MSSRLIHLYINLFIAFSSYSQIKSGKTGFISPTKEENPKLTGSFAEIRSNHFHSGLDFSTNGAIGTNLYAIGEGYVSRIKISASGYGKALYITHNNGFTSVYGHLDAYASKIDSLVTKLQYSQKKFDIDVNFSENEIPVKKGELVAISGNSGFSGGPHLHFELRDTESERVLNPFFHILGIQDNIKPIISTLVLYPLSDNSSINGKKTPQAFELETIAGKTRLKGNPTLSIAGEFGIGIKGYDLLNGSPRKCGIYSMSIRENGNSIFYFDIYTFAFDETRYVNSFSDYGAKILKDETIVRGYIQPNNHLSIYKRTINRGVMTVAPQQKSTVTVEVGDASKNISKIEFQIIGQKVVNTPIDESKKKRFVRCNETVTKTHNEITFNFEPASLYDDYYVAGSISAIDPKYNSPICRIGNREVPIHSKIDIELNIPSHLLKNKRFLTMNLINKKGELEYVKTDINNKTAFFSITEFGSCIFCIDSVAPKLTLSNAPKEANYKGRRYLTVTAKDAHSGINSFEGTIDGKWALFEYDKKNDLLLCPLSKAPIQKNKKHKLELVVTDKMNNKKTLNYSFTY